jgi:hypothetical protein
MIYQLLKSLNGRRREKELKGELCSGLQSIVTSLKHMKAEIHVSKINKSSSYFTENTLLLHYEGYF